MIVDVPDPVTVRTLETLKLVVVALVVVLLMAVKFCNVVDPVTKMLGEVKKPVESIVVVAVPPA